MANIPSEKIAEVRDRVDAERVIGRTVKLSKRGNGLTGLCPFHKEKSPSFSVDPRNKLYHCFGCGVGGDIFDFVMRIEAIEFPEAVRMLAQEAGVELPERQESAFEKRARIEAEKLYRTNALARDHFRARLKDNSVALDYLQKDRSLTEATIRAYELGFADDDWQGLSSFLQRNKVPADLPVKLGLVARRREGGVYDRVRGRVVFPIPLRDGKIAGFGARRADWLPQDEQSPKYLNSPESPVYDKSSIFYGIKQAHDTIRKTKRAILVEGYFDVIALHQAGVLGAVACCGTALSRKHAQILKKIADEVVTLYDGDAAGRNATRRASELLIEQGLNVRVLELPEGHDPDTFVKAEGVEALESALEASPGAIDYFIRAALAENRGAGIAGLVKTVASIRPLISKVSDPLARDLTIEGAARAMDIDPRVLRQHLKAPNQAMRGRTAQNEEPKAPGNPSAPLPPIPKLELAVLKHALDDPEKLQLLGAEGDVDAFTHELIQTILRTGLERAGQNTRFGPQQALEVAAETAEGDEKALRDIRETLLSVLPEQDDFNECLKRLRLGAIEARLRSLRQQIQRVQAKDPEAAARLSEELAAEMIRYKSLLS